MNSKKQRELSEKGQHYYISLGHCINQLMIIESMEKKGKFDTAILKQMQTAYKYIKK